MLKPQLLMPDRAKTHNADIKTKTLVAPRTPKADTQLPKELKELPTKLEKTKYYGKPKIQNSKYAGTKTEPLKQSKTKPKRPTQK